MIYRSTARAFCSLKVDTNDLTSGTLVLDVQEGSDLDASSKTGEVRITAMHAVVSLCFGCTRHREGVLKATCNLLCSSRLCWPFYPL